VLFVDAVDVGVVERVELEVELLLAGGDAGVSDAHGRTSLYIRYRMGVSVLSRPSMI
jgi:hypothetical protein